MSLASFACVSPRSGARVSPRLPSALLALLVGRASVLWAALLCCLLALAQPMRADVTISTDITINYAIGDYVDVEGSPTVALVAGGSIYGALLASNTSTVNISGGSIAKYLIVGDTSTINVSGGSIAGYLYANNSSMVNVSGGSVGGDLYASDASTVNVSGGSIAGYLYVSGSSTINVYGTGLRLAGPFTDPYNNTYVTLTGTLADGALISNKTVYLGGGAQISQVVLHETNPFVALKAQVQALVDAGTLNAGNANALLVKLTAAQTASAAGDTASERDALTAFVNQVNAFVRTSKLTAAQGSALTSAAQAILDGIH